LRAFFAFSLAAPFSKPTLFLARAGRGFDALYADVLDRTS